MNTHRGNQEFYFKGSEAYTEDNILIYNLFIYKVPIMVTEDLVKEYFSKYGDVKHLNFYRANNKRYSRYKVGFVNFVDPCAAAKVLKKTRHTFKNYHVFVKPCYSWTQPHADDVPNTVSQINEPSYIFNLNDDCLLHIFKMLKFREQLNFARSCDRFKALFMQYNKIQDFKLDSLDSVTMYEAREFFKIAGSKIIKISGIIPSNDVDRYIDMIGLFCNNVESIAFSNIKINVAVLRKWITKWPKLTKLAFGTCMLNDSCFKIIKQITNLTSLTVNFSSDITGKYIDELVNLTELNLRGCLNVTLSNMTSILKNLKDLNKLDIRYCERVSAQNHLDSIISEHGKLSEVKISATELKNILKLPQLKLLEVQHHDRFLSMPSHLFQAMTKETNSQIEHLTLEVVDSVNLERAKGIANLKNLKYLKIYASSELNDDCLHLLAEHLKQLEEINLEKCRSITSRGLMALVKECKNLKKINIKGIKTITETFVLNVIEELKSRIAGNRVPLEIELASTSSACSIEQNDIYINSKSLVNLKIDYSYTDFYYEMDSDYSDSDMELNSDDEDAFDVWNAIINNFDIGYSDDDDDDYLYYDHDLLNDFDQFYHEINF